MESDQVPKISSYWSKTQYDYAWLLTFQELAVTYKQTYSLLSLEFLCLTLSNHYTKREADSLGKCPCWVSWWASGRKSWKHPQTERYNSEGANVTQPYGWWERTQKPEIHKNNQSLCNCLYLQNCFIIQCNLSSLVRTNPKRSLLETCWHIDTPLKEHTKNE